MVREGVADLSVEKPHGMAARIRSKGGNVFEAVVEDRRKPESFHITCEIVRIAGNMSEKHALRGFDAIHLVSAMTLREKLDSPVCHLCMLWYSASKCITARETGSTPVKLYRISLFPSALLGRSLS